MQRFLCNSWVLVLMSFVCYDRMEHTTSPSTGWEKALQDRVVALLTTVLYEEVFLPLEAALCTLSDELIGAMVTRLGEVTGTSDVEQVKAQLIAESEGVAAQRAQWDVESRNLHDALTSIASLQGDKC